MIAVIQRVSESSVAVEGKTIGRIGRGLMVLLGIGTGDIEGDADYLVDKIVGLRIFEDDQGKMNHSLLEVGGEMLVVSQFTLLGDCRKGRRPSFGNAADPDTASRLYEYFVHQVAEKGVKLAQGRFGAMMAVSLVNDGPVTLIVESPY